MVLIDFLKKAWTIVHGFGRFFEKKHGLQFMVLIDFLKESVDYIVHGFNRFFEKSMDYSHGFDRFFKKSMDYSSWF